MRIGDIEPGLATFLHHQVFIARLRRKLGASFIQTVRGLGYRVEGANREIVSGYASARFAVLWTLALLAVAHRMFLVVVFHKFPVSHRIILVCALLIMSAGALLVSSALVPFRRLRGRLRELRDGRSQTIEGSYPTEVQPLIDDLNHLLEQRERALQRAQAKAGDLAHGLKTPLQLDLHNVVKSVTHKSQTQ